MTDSLRRHVVAALILAGLTLGLASAADAQAPTRPIVVGGYLAGQNVSVGAAWTDIVRGDWVSLTSRTIPSDAQMAELTVVNTHATQALFVLFRANAAEATTHMLYIGAGAARTIPLWGQGVSTISVQGAGAATTAKLDSTWAKP